MKELFLLAVVVATTVWLLWMLRTRGPRDRQDVDQ